METRIDATFEISLRDIMQVMVLVEDSPFFSRNLEQIYSNTYHCKDEETYWEFCDLLESNNFEYTIN
jgi:hypothetical protein